MSNLSSKLTPLILGSASPRRKELLAYLPLPISIQIANVDEDTITITDPAENVRQRAVLKAEALAPIVENDPNAIIITADTSVAIEHELLNKPVDAAEAYKMLTKLRDRIHQVHTGYVIRSKQHQIDISDVDTTQVVMRSYSDQEIDAYIQTGDPMDKAGAYAIQSRSFRPVAQLDGCYTGVMGLPMCRIVNALTASGVKLSDNSQKQFQRAPNSMCQTCKQLFHPLE